MGAKVSIVSIPSDFSSEFNDNNISSNASEIGDPLTCESISWFQFVLNTIVISLLCVSGLAGNTVSILVLQKDRHNRVAVFLLQALAIAHNCVLCLVFVGLSVAYGLLPVADPVAHVRLRPYVLKYFNPLGNIAQSTVIFLTVLLAVNRYIAVCRPFTAKRWLTMKYARIQVAFVVAMSVLLNVPRVFMYESISSGVRVMGCTVTLDPTFNRSELGRNKDFEKIYLNGIYTSLVLFLPLVLLVGFSVPLIRQMQRSKRRMKRNSLSYRGRQENSITMVMIVIIAELIVCHATDRASIVARLMLVKGTTPADLALLESPHPLFFAMNVTNLLVILNSCTDFFIYYIFRRRFRRILCERMFCCSRMELTPSPVHSDPVNGNAIYSLGNINNNSRHRRKSPDVLDDKKSDAIKELTLKERYKRTKKRTSNQILLIKFHTIT